MVRIVCLGDVMLGRLVNDVLGRGSDTNPWGDTLDHLRSANVVLANLECALTRHDTPWSRTSKVFHFRADPRRAKVLKDAHVAWVSLANNHTLDFEIGGLLETLHVLDAADIAHSGAGATAGEARRPAMIQAGPLRIALFSLTDNEPAFAATPGTPGVWWIDPRDKEAGPTVAEIDACRSAGAGLVVLAAHLGPNMVQEPSRVLRRFKTRMAKRGIDLVIGHSAHLVQGVERVGRSLVLHDLGDMLDDYQSDPELHNDWSVMAVVDADAGGLQRLTLIPIELGFANVNLARGVVFLAICERLERLSARFGTRFERTGEGLVLPLSAVTRGVHDG
jgi:poly-gamma-glutamate capsule biosynthesis protein CapA/YwtB (metallophosphatase superfamily)